MLFKIQTLIKCSVFIQFVTICISQIIERREFRALLNPEIRARPASIWASGLVETGEVFNSPLTKGPFANLLNGEGEVVGTIDTGVDMNSCYFRDVWSNSVELFRYQTSLNETILNLTHRKILQYISLTGIGDKIDNYFGHGTHATGLLLGKCSEESVLLSMFDGVVPSAKLAIFDANDDKNFTNINLGGLSLYNIYLSLQASGVKIFSNPWVVDNTSILDGDLFMWDNPDSLLVAAAGNDGMNSGTLSSHMISKNVLTVGASANSATALRYAYTSEPERFDSIDKNVLMGYSTIFPETALTGIYMLKPDVVAPGWRLASAYGGNSQLYNHCTVQFMDGTSQASSLVTGYAVKVRQYFLKGYYPSGRATASDGFTPSGALIKAILIHSGQRLTKRLIHQYPIYNGGETPMVYENISDEYPSRYYGYGRVQLNKVLHFSFSQQSSNFTLFVTGGVDKYNDVITNEAPIRLYEVTTGENKAAIRITFVYTDYVLLDKPHAMVNNLTVTVVDVNGKVWSPHVPVGFVPGTVQMINIPKESVIPSSVYTVNVSTSGLYTASQSFALVVTGVVQFVPRYTFTPCESGSVLRYSVNSTIVGHNFHCDPCAPGTYSDRTNSENVDCMLCPVNSYQDEIGKDQCKSCPAGSLSFDVGNKAVDDCYYASLSFTLAIVCIIVNIYIVGRYYCDGKIFYYIWERRVSWLRYGIAASGAVIQEVHNNFAMDSYLKLRGQQVEKSEKTGKISSHFNLLLRYFVYWLTVCLIFIVTFLIIIINALFDVLYYLLILRYKSYFTDSIEEAVTVFLTKMDLFFSLGPLRIPVRTLSSIWTYLSTMTLELRILQVNCSGAQSAMYTLINLLASLVLLIAIASDVQFIWGIAVVKAAKRVLSLIFTTTVASLRMMSLHDILFYHIAIFVLIIPQPISVLQFALSFFSLSTTLSLTSSPACDKAFDDKNYDYWLTLLGGFVFAALAVQPVSFIVAQVIAANCPYTLIVEDKAQPAGTAEDASANAATTASTLAAASATPTDYSTPAVVPAITAYEPPFTSAVNKYHENYSSPIVELMIGKKRHISLLAAKYSSLLTVDWLVVNGVIYMCRRFQLYENQISDTFLHKVFGQRYKARYAVRLLHARVLCDKQMQKLLHLDRVAIREEYYQALDIQRAQSLHSSHHIPMAVVDGDVAENPFSWNWLSYSKQYLTFFQVIDSVGTDLLYTAEQIQDIHDNKLSVISRVMLMISYFCVQLFSFFPGFMLLSRKGRQIWWRSSRSFWWLFLMSFGIWTEGMEQDFQVVKTMMWYQSVLLTYKRNFQKSISHYPTLHSFFTILPHFEMHHEEIGEQVDDNLHLLQSIVLPRMLLFQIIPLTAFLNIFVMKLAVCPLFVFSPKLAARLPPFLETNPIEEAYRILRRSDYPFSLPPTWKVYIVALDCFLHCRLVLYAFNLVAIILLLALIIAPAMQNSIFAEVMFLVWVTTAIFVKGTSQALSYVLLAHRAFFPSPQAQLKLHIFDETQIESDSDSDSDMEGKDDSDDQSKVSGVDEEDAAALNYSKFLGQGGIFDTADVIKLSFDDRNSDSHFSENNNVVHDPKMIIGTVDETKQHNVNDDDEGSVSMGI